MSKPRPINLTTSLVVLCAFAWFPHRADAQQTPTCEDGAAHIVGVVIDTSTEAPLEGAYVSVAASDWGSLTTDDGRYLLCEIGSGTQVVTAERLGYETLIVAIEANASGSPVQLRMRPDPILLEGLEIVTNRFDRRRRASAHIVWAYDQEELASSPYWTAADFVDSRPGVFTTPCGINRCIYSRGQMVEPTVYLDEFLLIGGWTQLESLPTSQLYMIEVYRRGTHIRAYTHGFMERAAKIRLAPLAIW